VALFYSGQPLLEFTAGYIEVYRDGLLISRHRMEREAIQSIQAHAETAESGEYEIRQPVIKVKHTRTATVVSGAINGAVTI
jgi:hypothetical protein